MLKAITIYILAYALLCAAVYFYQLATGWSRNKCRFEFKWQDMWVGGFVRDSRIVDEPGAQAWNRDIWLIGLPMMPLHLTFMKGYVYFNQADIPARSGKEE